MRGLDGIYKTVRYVQRTLAKPAVKRGIKWTTGIGIAISLTFGIIFSVFVQQVPQFKNAKIAFRSDEKPTFVIQLPHRKIDSVGKSLSRAFSNNAQAQEEDTVGVTRLADGELASTQGEPRRTDSDSQTENRAAQINDATIINDAAIKVEIKNNAGNETEVESKVEQIEDNKVQITLNEDQDNIINPGKYTLETQIEQDGKTYNLTQDFTWGVLAINPDRSIYSPNQEAFLAMGVLDDRGMMVCDAKVELEITDPKGQKIVLSTVNKEIVIAPTCTVKDITEKPDYYGYYKTGAAGEYKMKLRAETQNGPREIEDRFYVEENPLFEIKREGPTRIYPPKTYEMKMTVKPREDFKGEVTENVPDSFEISNDPSTSLGVDKSQVTNKFQITNDQNVKQIAWQVDWKAGESYELAYQFNVPHISPQFYLMGPLEIRSQGNKEIGSQGDIVFKEPRQWQIAADQISLKAAGTWARIVTDPSSVTIPGTPAAGDRMFLFVTWKTYTITVANPAGWTPIGTEYADGTTAAGVGTGSVKVMAWYRDWVSGDGNPSVDWSAAPTEGHGVVMLWQKGAGDTWAAPTTVTGAIAAADPFTVNASATTTVPSGSVVMGLIGLRDDSATMTRATDALDDTGALVTWNGNYVESPATHFSSTTGQDMSGDLGHRFVTTGASGVTLHMDGDISAAESGAAKWVVQGLAPQITVSGGCFTDAGEGTACTDGGASDQIKVAVNGTLDAGSDGTVDGAWTFTINQPASGAILTFFRDGAPTAAEKATTVVKYDGDGGNVTLVKMYQSQLVIGADAGSTNSDQTITNSDLDTTGNGYEYSDDPDSIYGVDTGVLTVDQGANLTETLYIISGDIFRPDSAGGDTVTTHHLYFEGTYTTDNNATNVARNWTNAGTFTATTGTVTFNGTAAQTITSNAVSFYLVTFNNSSVADPNISYTGAMTIGNNTTLSNTTRIESTNNTAITFTGTINGGNILTINAGTSSSTFSDIIGGSTPIQTLAVTASTAINLNGGAITLAANYGATFTGPVSLGASTTINVSGTAHTVNFTSTINGANTLTVSGGANTTATFGGVIGGVTPIQTLAVTATTAINLNTTAITLASGYNATFTGPVSLGAGVTVTTSGANTVNFTSTINSADATDRALTLTSGTGGDIIISGAIGATNDLASLTIGAAGTANDVTIANIGGGSAGITGATAITATNGGDNAVLTFTGTAYNTNAATYTGGTDGIRVNDNATFTTSNDTIGFTGVVNSLAATNKNVTLAAGSAQVTFNDNVGATQSLGVLEKQGSGDVLFGTNTLTATGLTLSAGTINTLGTDSGAWTISSDVTISAGTLKATTNTFSVGGNWANSDTFTAGSGTVDFTKGSGTQTLNSGGTGAGKLFNNLTHSGAGTLQLITNAIDINGVFTNSNGTFDANDFNMNVADDFLVSGGSFSADVAPGATTQTVTFDGTNEATISGSNVFNNLTMNTTGIGAKTIKFPTGLGSKQTINGTWTLDGAVGQVLTLLSVSDATAWEFVIPADINPAGDYIDVKDSQNNTNAFRITAGTDTNDNGNNVPGWLFPSANTAPDNPDPATFVQAKTDDTVIATGNWTNETDVKFSATASDPDNPDTLYLCVEIKAIADAFDGTESCDAIGVAYAGTPVTVTKTITGVTDAQYHWRVRIKDAGGLYSNWVAYGGNPAGDGTGDGSPANRDYGIDTSDPTGGTVYDGTSAGVDADYNTGSLTQLSANWDSFDATTSGLNKYQYAIGTTVGGTDIRTWTDNSTTTSVTATITGGALANIYTSRMYYFSVRAVDNAGNTQDPVISSNGQKILPQLTFALSTNTITFDNLNNANNYNNSKTFTVNPISNAYNGFTVKAYKSQLLTSIPYPTKTIPDFEGGTYGTPGSWPGALCTPLTNCGFGYSSSDDNVGGSNRFEPVGGFGTKFAPFSSTPSGETIADHETTVTGSTGQADDTYTISSNVAVDASQSATQYQTTLTFVVTANF